MTVVAGNEKSRNSIGIGEWQSVIRVPMWIGERYPKRQGVALMTLGYQVLLRPQTFHRSMYAQT